MSHTLSAVPSEIPQRVSALESRADASEGRMDRTDATVTRLDDRMFKALIALVLIFATGAVNLLMTYQLGRSAAEQTPRTVAHADPH